MQYIAVVAGAVLAAAVVVWLILRSGGSEGRRGSSRGAGSGTAGGGGESEPPETAAASRRNWILGTSGNVADKSFHVGERTVTIGRKPTNFIQVADGGASRVHCKIDGRATGAQLLDMNSSAGTFLNGEKLEPNEEYPLEDGDTFRVASVEFEYRLTGDFEENYGITAPKTTGQKFETSTKLGAGAEWRQAVEQALEAADGDPEQAADELGVDTEVFMQLLEQTDLSSD